MDLAYYIDINKSFATFFVDVIVNYFFSFNSWEFERIKIFMLRKTCHSVTFHFAL